MNVQLHTIDQGAGPPVLLVHGFPMDHTMWRFQIESLAASHRVIAPDLRGFGQSPIESISSKIGVAMADYADDLARLLDKLAVEEPVTLVGFSMGGYISWQFYKRHRQRLRAMIQCDTKAAADTPQARETRFKMAEHVEGWGAAHVATLMVPKLLAPSTLQGNTKLVEEIGGMISRTDPVAIAAAQRGMAHREDSTPLLESLDLPVLYIVGQDDQISTTSEMQTMADAAPDGRLVTIPNAGHLSPIENPTAVTAAMEEFLASLPT